MGKKRSNEMIIESILQACTNGTNKTKMIYQSNLNSCTITPYINLLMYNDLIEVDQTMQVTYKTTKKGYEFMRSLKRHNDEILKLTLSLAGTI